MIQRLEPLTKGLPQDIGAALISSRVNRRYYLDFYSTAGTLLVSREKSAFIIDSRYYEMACEAITGCEVILQDKLYEQVAAWLKQNGIKTLAVESKAVTLDSFSELNRKLPKTSFIADNRLSKLILEQRARKDASELASIKAAQAIAEKTLAHILDYIKPGRTELEIAIELEEYGRRHGSEKPAFDYIVAAGKNSSKPHAEPSHYKVRAGDFVTLDFGMTVNGYRSDMTRTIAVSHASDKQQEVYGLVLKAQLAALEKIKAGARCFEIDKTARDIIDATAYEGLFGHGLGHSLGLEIHEQPSFSPLSEAILPAGAVMSVEPGVYIPGEFGVRIEDIVCVTENDCENLTAADKKLLVI
jgi:Xaa-Pro aminopeptidase